MENSTDGDTKDRLKQNSNKLNLEGNQIFLNRITSPEPLSNDLTTHLISFDELLEPKDKLKKVLLTSYVWEPKFITKHFPPSVPITLACHWEHPKRAGKRKSTICVEHGTLPCKCQQSSRRELEVIYPPFPEDIDGNMHSKLMILRFSSHLRIVISSGNLQERDWDALSQNIWYQDFQGDSKKSKGNAKGKTDDSLPNFEDILTSFLESLPVEPDEFLKGYDLSTARPHLIASIPGVYKESQLHRYGHMRLRSLVSKVPWDSTQEKDTSLDYQTASIGAIRPEWLSEFLWSSQGKEKKQNEDPTQTMKFRVLFPTFFTVANASFVQGARTICYWDKLGLTKKKLHHIENQNRPNVLCQSKILMRSSPDGQYGWLYAGSHNLSSSAWGRLSDGNQLQINNYELGVLFLPSDKSENSTETSLQQFTLPFKSNPSKYSQTDRPWVIPKKSKLLLHGNTIIRIHLYILPEKYIFVPPVEDLKLLTGADVIRPPQPCINLAKFGTCKYGDKCKFSHTYYPVEVAGRSESVFEASRVIMEAVNKNSYSIGITILFNETSYINGWLWKINDQPKFTMFIPDTSNPLSNDANLDVFVLNDQQKQIIQHHLGDLAFLSGASVWFGLNNSRDPHKHHLYIFGTKNAMKSAETSFNLLSKKEFGKNLRQEPEHKESNEETPKKQE